MENLHDFNLKSNHPSSSQCFGFFVPMMTLPCPGLLHALHLLAYFLQELVTTATKKYKKCNECFLNYIFCEYRLYFLSFDFKSY